MKRNGVLFAALLALTPIAAAGGCNTNLYVCDDPSYEEVWTRALSQPTITRQRSQLGTWWAKTHERVLEAHLHGDWSCVEYMAQTPRGNINTALCMPDWMRRVNPTMDITFVYQDDISRQQTLRRVIYLASPTSIGQGYYNR